MQIEHLKELQNFILETIKLSPDIELSSQFNHPAANALVEKTRYRLQAHRTSFYLKSSSVLCDCVFEPACHLLSKEFVANFLMEFFSVYNSQEDIIALAKHFPNFLWEHENIKACPFVPDFIELCLLRYDILHAKNPDTSLFLNQGNNQLSPSNIYLQKNHVFFSSSWPIFQMLEASQQLEEIFEENKTNKSFDKAKEGELKLSELINKPESILLVKSGPLTLESIFVPHDYVPLMKLLCDKLSLEAALEEFEIDENNFDASEFSNWISILTQKKALGLF